MVLAKERKDDFLLGCLFWGGRELQGFYHVDGCFFLWEWDWGREGPIYR